MTSYFTWGSKIQDLVPPPTKSDTNDNFHVPTMEDMARRQSMRKKRKLKRGATGIWVIASGYTWVEKNLGEKEKLPGNFWQEFCHDFPIPS